MSEAHVHAQLSLFRLFSLAATSGLVVMESVYLRGWLSLRKAFPGLISGWRLATFTTGLISIWAALASPLATLDHQSLTIHMMKHLLLMTFAAPLVLAGAPAFTLTCGLPKLFIQSNPPLAGLSERWLGRCLMNPASCWLAGTAVVIGWHLPHAFQLGMRFQWAHNIEDICFLLAGLLFWWPIVQLPPTATRSPGWSMALYLFLATLPCDILSAFLVFCGRPVYPFYLSATQLFGLSPLQDQECAGALMWVWVTFAYLIPAVVITIYMLSVSNSRSSKPMQAARARLAVRSSNAGGAEVF